MSRVMDQGTPTCLIVPGLRLSGRNHWPSLWERRRDDCARVDLRGDDDPIRNVWLGRLDQAIGAAGQRVVLVGHGLGALTIAWWAALMGRRAGDRVAAALLVSPSDPERAGAEPSIRRFGPLPTAMLPFPSILVANRSDHRLSVGRAREMAGEWLSDFVELGEGDSPMRAGAWREGERMLDLLLDGGPGLSRYAYRPEPPVRAATAGPAMVPHLHLAALR